MSVRRNGARVAAAVACAVALASCSHSSPRATLPAATSAPAHPEVLVSLGSSAAIDDTLDYPLSDSWPQVLYRTAFPRSTVFVNAAAPQGNVSIATAMAQEVPLALLVHATVVAVWLGDRDLVAGVPTATFESSLTQLVARLRQSGARVILGTFTVGGGISSAAYNQAIERVADAQGATVANVAAALSATPSIGPSSDANVAESKAIAEAFVAAVARS